MYCGVLVTIPELLRWTKITTSTPMQKPKFDPFAAARNAVSPELRQKTLEQNQQVSNILNKVAPVANTAYQGYAWWIILKNFLAPVFLIVFSACCVLTLAAGGAIWYLSNQ
jgi:hypothetical protein